jgi:hypothetical protein
MFRKKYKLLASLIHSICVTIKLPHSIHHIRTDTHRKCQINMTQRDALQIVVSDDHVLGSLSLHTTTNHKPSDHRESTC